MRTFLVGRRGARPIDRQPAARRSTRDLLNVLHEVGERGAAFKSIHDAWCDTATPHGKLLLVVLGGLAEFDAHCT
jgi:DNA invertase Pin-like site-specific DNA recombinase